jgi:hypothetical protein
MTSKRANGPFVALAMIVIVVMMSTETFAAIGDQPLTQLAKESSMFSLNMDGTAVQLTGVTMDSTGIMFATWHDGVLRVPPSVTTGDAIDNVAEHVLTGLPVTTIFDPCRTNPSPPTSDYYTCVRTGREYLGDFMSLFYRDTARGSGFHLPWTYNDRLYLIAKSPTHRILQYDQDTFSIRDPSYNAIVNANLNGAMKVLFNPTTSFVYIFSNAESGNAVVIRIPMATIGDPAQTDYRYLQFADASFADITWNTAKDTFYFLGRSGSVANGVWSIANNDATFALGTPQTATAVSMNAATCADSGVTIAYDADANRGDRVYVGCTGQLTTRGSIEALNPTTFANVNQTWLDTQDDLFTSWVHDPISGILYIGTQGRAASNGYSGVIQFSTVHDRREGRSETVEPFNVLAMAMSTLTVPEGETRAGSPYFYVVGQQTTSQYPSVARWEAAQGCLDQCGATATPVRGSCTRRECTCGNYVEPVTGQTLTWLAPWCSSLTCPYNCNGQGVCQNSTCQCDRTWTTVDPNAPCLEPRCPNDCFASLNHGECIRNGTNYPDHCQCAPGWSGDDCSLKAKFPCHLLTNNCTGCVDNPACVWCSSARTCVEGDANGPFAPLSEFECRSWFWGSCPSVAIDIVNYLMTAILGICLLISFISGTLVDTSAENPERRTEWYLFQRAGKIWSMIYQLQLIAVAGLINFTYPTSFAGFVRYWNWILLAWGFPWHHSKGSMDAWYDSSRTTGRSTASWEQYMTYWKAQPDNIFFTFLLWWGVALGVFLVFYVIMLVISIIRGGRTGFLAKTRPVFVALRILELGHLGVCVIGPLALIKGGASAIVGGIFWVVLGLGAPVGLYVWLGFIKDKKELFKPTFAAAFYPYYGAFDFRYRMFIVVPWIKRILIGLFIGFIATSNPVGQLIPIAIVHLAYLLFVIIQRNMFSDYLQRYLEIILAALNLAAFLFLFGFYGTPSAGLASAMGIIFLILQFLAVTISACFFVISWLQLNQVYSVVQCIKFCTCRGEK